MALGELVAEKSGILNIGIEGMMLLGAVVTLIVVHRTGSPTPGVAAAGLLAALAFGIIAIGLGVNQYFHCNPAIELIYLTCSRH